MQLVLAHIGERGQQVKLLVVGSRRGREGEAKGCLVGASTGTCRGGKKAEGGCCCWHTEGNRGGSGELGGELVLAYA